ncbi:hypothetical protein FSP39_012277 [Pinctada imbricata]|uniref:G-protein coupled receptors family 2 profile 2 domain-containing protein n=1 Tax=Pinctada imbricata TaxID=66713 RepID=A0AA88Y089_PINIB|nr:hypothetical protein FSP39_012277 [Pinctada imbricata]
MWSTSGCEVITTTDENTIDEIHDLALNIITYVGCSVSLLTQIIAVTVFTCVGLLCSIVAFVLHYFYTSVFVWMLVEGLHLYSKVVQVFGTEKSRLIYYCGFGWGVPLILVTISATADWRGYGTQRSCWLSTKDGTIWAFVGPAVAIIVRGQVVGALSSLKWFGQGPSWSPVVTVSQSASFKNALVQDCRLVTYQA